MRERERLLEVAGDRLLVGVDEDQVVRLGLLGDQAVERVRGRARRARPRASPTPAWVSESRGDAGVLRVDLERRQAAVGGQRASEPERAVPAERADLEDPPRTDRLREQVQELALVGGDGDVRQPAGGRRVPGVDQGDVLGHEHREVVVDVRSRARRGLGRRREGRGGRRERGGRAEALGRGDVDAARASARCRAHRRPGSWSTGAPRERGGDRLRLLRAGGDHPDLAGAADRVVASARRARAAAWGSRARRPSDASGDAERLVARGTARRRARRGPCRAAATSKRGSRPPRSVGA